MGDAYISYYPFGLTFNSYKRVTAKENKYNTFQDQEKITALDLNWIQFKWRNHDPTIGRFFNVDPLAEKYVYNSPYAFSENKVISFKELEGLEAVWAQVEGRMSVPLLPTGQGITVSGALGVAFDFSKTAETGNVKGMVYKTLSAGVQNGIYMGAGIEFGALPTGSLEDMKGLGANLGASVALDLYGGPGCRWRD